MLRGRINKTENQTTPATSNLENAEEVLSEKKASSSFGERLMRTMRPSGYRNIQMKSNLEIGEAGDKYEQEADEVADKVMRMPEDKEKVMKQPEDSPVKISRKADSMGGTAAPDHVEQGISSSKGGGQSLPDSTQSELGNKMGADFSGVKVHTDSNAVQMSQDIGAKAFTHGNDIYFNKGAYNPSSNEGKHLLAHELTHTVQQGTSIGRMVQCMCSACTGIRTSENKKTDVGHDKLNRKTIQRIPQNPTDTPFDATIIPWNAALHAAPSRSGTTLADLPRGHKVKVLGGQAWIQVETTYNGELLTGYISHELLKKIEGSGPIDLFGDKLISWDPSKPERITITGNGVTPKMIAKDLYNNESLATTIIVEWDKKKDGDLYIDTKIPVGKYVKLQYRYLKPELQTIYDGSINIYSRELWNARENRPHEEGVYDYFQYTDPLESIYHSIAIHHSGNSGYKTMKEVQDHHMDEKDKADIGYHYGINLQGKIYEGRPIQVKGANIDNGNTGVIGIVLLADLDTQGSWDYEDDSLTSQMESSLLKLIHHLIGKYPGIKHLGGHKEFNANRTCPGDLGMAKMGSWRSSTSLTIPVPVESNSSGDD